MGHLLMGGTANSARHRRAGRGAGHGGAIAGRHQISVGGVQNLDTAGFVAALQELNATPHVAQNTSNHCSAIDGRTTRHAGYAVSQRIRKRIEEGFGWIKETALQRRARHHGKNRVGMAVYPGGYDLQPDPAKATSCLRRRSSHPTSR